MILVDSHCHALRDWYEPVESLICQMDRNGVEHAVLVQILAESNNDYLFECLRRYPGRFAVVVRVDEASPQAADELGRLQDRGAQGVRFTTSTRSAGADPLALWRRAAQLGLPVSCAAERSEEYASDQFAQLIGEFPGLPIVIEHMGGLNHPSEKLASLEARRRVFALSRFPNVYLKIHGLGEFCERTVLFLDPRPFGGKVLPLLQMAYEAFGPDRILWGSDYPPVSSREGYRNALRWPLEQLATKSQRDREQTFGGVALHLFGPV